MNVCFLLNVQYIHYARFNATPFEDLMNQYSMLSVNDSEIVVTPKQSQPWVSKKEPTHLGYPTKNIIVSTSSSERQQRAANKP